MALKLISGRDGKRPPRRFCQVRLYSKNTISTSQSGDNHAFDRAPCPLRPLAAALWAGLAGAGLASQALAGDLGDFNAAVEAASSHNRGAIGYLRTGNTDLASLEVDRLRDAWRKLTARFAGHRPDAFDGNPLYPTLFTAVDARLVGADMMLNAGRAQAARQSLEAIRTDLHKLRQASGIVVLADCIGDSSDAVAALMVSTSAASTGQSRDALRYRRQGGDLRPRAGALRRDGQRSRAQGRRIPPPR